MSMGFECELLSCRTVWGAGGAMGVGPYVVITRLVCIPCCFALVLDYPAGWGLLLKTYSHSMFCIVLSFFSNFFMSGVGILP